MGKLQLLCARLPFHFVSPLRSFLDLPNEPSTDMMTSVHYINLSHTLGADEHHLSNKELLALTDILQEDLTDRLKQIGLDFGDAQRTIEEVQRLLCSLGEHEIASNLRQYLDLGKHLRITNGHRIPHNKSSYS